MPKGPKKRKSLKKKKDVESHNQNPNQQPHSDVSQIHGNDDLKPLDGNESDVSSPSSANHQHQFTDEEKEEVGRTDDSTQVQLASVEKKFDEETKENGVAVKATGPDDRVGSEESLKPDVESNIRNTVLEHVGSQNGREDGVSSQAMNESGIQIEIEGEPFDKYDKNAAMQDIEHEKNSSEEGLPRTDIDEFKVIDKINVAMDDSSFTSSTEAANLLSEGLTLVPNIVPVGENYGSVVDSEMGAVSDNSGPVSEKISIDSVTSGNNSASVKCGIDEQLKKEAAWLDQKDTSSVNLQDAGLENENVEDVATKDARNSRTQETKEMSLSEVNQSSDNQPLLGSAAQPIQRTSWMSCCGMLDVFAGSNR